MAKKKRLKHSKLIIPEDGRTILVLLAEKSAHSKRVYSVAQVYKGSDEAEEIFLTLLRNGFSVSLIDEVEFPGKLLVARELANAELHPNDRMLDVFTMKLPYPMDDQTTSDNQLGTSDNECFDLFCPDPIGSPCPIGSTPKCVDGKVNCEDKRTPDGCSC